MATRMDKLQEMISGLRKEAAAEVAVYDAMLAQMETPKNTTKPKASRPCCTKQEVVEVLVGLLRDNATLTRTELEELAKHKLSKERGKSLSGFAMRFKEALADPLFTEFEPGQCRLSRKDERSGREC